MLTQTLSGLRDVDEVQGSFLLGEEGGLLARDLPAVFHQEIFTEVGPRLARVREMFDAGHEPSTLTLRYADHKLHIRSVGSMLLCVLSGAHVNGPALRMAINLVARRLAAHAGEAEQELPTRSTNLTPPPPSLSITSPAASITAPPPSVGPAPESATSRRVLYRGRPI